MNPTTAITRESRDTNSTEYLTEQAASDLPGTARSAVQLLRLPLHLRAIAHQERTYRLNTEPGWRPSDLMARVVDGLLRNPDGGGLTSPVAREMVAGLDTDQAKV